MRGGNMLCIGEWSRRPPLDRTLFQALVAAIDTEVGRRCLYDQIMATPALSSRHLMFRRIHTQTGLLRTEVDLRRGVLRLGIGLAVLWIVFWTFAYVMRPLSSENGPPLPALAPTTDISLILVVVLGLPWVLRGFRTN
jgi:hypothetical protein